MREVIALVACLLTAGIIILLSGLSASRRNQLVAASQHANDHEPDGTPNPASVETDDGAAVFEKQRCYACHSFKGRGNARSPLDGVADHLSPEELREWITGTGSAAPLLPVALVRRKANYLKLSDAEMSALIRYLSPPDTSTNRSRIRPSPR